MNVDKDIKKEIVDNLRSELNFLKNEKEELIDDLADTEIAINTYNEAIRLIEWNL